MQYDFFLYFDPTCLICYSIASYKLVTFILFAKLYPANYLNASNSSVTLIKANLLLSKLIVIACKWRISIKFVD